MYMYIYCGRGCQTKLLGGAALNLRANPHVSEQRGDRDRVVLFRGFRRASYDRSRAKRYVLGRKCYGPGRVPPVDLRGGGEVLPIELDLSFRRPTL